MKESSTCSHGVATTEGVLLRLTVVGFLSPFVALVSKLGVKLPAPSTVSVRRSSVIDSSNGATTFLPQFEIFARFMSLQDVIKVVRHLHKYPSIITSVQR